MRSKSEQPKPMKEIILFQKLGDDFVTSCYGMFIPYRKPGTTFRFCRKGEDFEKVSGVKGYVVDRDCWMDADAWEYVE